MHHYNQAAAIDSILSSAKHIVVVQADNPDGDSLGSALALEQILSEQGKTVSLYAGVDMPSYLHYLAGWDRVSKELPHSFDVSIIVDASTLTLLEKLQTTHQLPRLKTKPCIVLDHHSVVERPIEFSTITICDVTAASTGELIHQLAMDLGWPMDPVSASFLMTSILGDTQGLTNDLTQASTYRTMAQLVDYGVDRPALEELRREASKMPAAIFRYKGRLIARTELHADGRIAYVDIPQAEINEFSALYNPGPLVQFDMLQIDTVQVAIVIKHYDDGKVTAAIRANHGTPIAAQLAEMFGGGGHPYASGFKVTDGRTFSDIKTACLAQARTLLDTLNKEDHHETLQHAD